MIKPHIRLWAAGKSRASGHIEIEGFLPNSVLRLTGYAIKSENPLSDDEEKRKALEAIDGSLIQFLRKKFPQCEITVSPATILRQAVSNI
jgi:hypothetical protein